MRNFTRRFLDPVNPTHRRALRAYDGLPVHEAAGRPGTVRNLCSDRNPDQAFFLTGKPGPTEPDPGGRLEQRIVALRRERNLSIVEIEAALAREGVALPPGSCGRQAAAAAP